MYRYARRVRADKVDVEHMDSIHTLEWEPPLKQGSKLWYYVDSAMIDTFTWDQHEGLVGGFPGRSKMIKEKLLKAMEESRKARRVKAQETGWVACDYTEGDMIDDVNHGNIHSNEEYAEQEKRRYEYEGVRWVDTDGYLYVDKPHQARKARRVRAGDAETFEKKLDQAMNSLVSAWDFSRGKLTVNDYEVFIKTYEALERIYEVHNISAR